MKNRASTFVVAVVGTLALAAPAAAQEPALAPAFEVAAIAQVQPSPQAMADIQSGALQPRMLVTETRLSITFLSLRDIVRRAYGVEHYQMSAPDWMGGTRWNIHATMPAGATRGQVPAMLQRLLAERFGLVVRREPQPFPVYALVVGSGGALLRQTDHHAPGAGPLASADTGAPDASVQTMESETSSAVMKMSPGSGGNVRVDFIGMPMAELASMLTEFVERPVVDRTALVGFFDFALEFSSPPMSSGLGEGFGAPRGATGREPAGSASVPPGQNAAVRSLEKVGLALEARRELIEMVIVESVERVPTPN